MQKALKDNHLMEVNTAEERALRFPQLEYLPSHALTSRCTSFTWGELMRIVSVPKNGNTALIQHEGYNSKGSRGGRAIEAPGGLRWSNRSTGGILSVVFR